MKRKNKKWIIFLIGFLLCISPLVSGIFGGIQQNDVISTYETQSKSFSKEELKQTLMKAEEYNNMLYQTNGAVVGTINTEILERYDSLLNLTGTGVMGSIEIPKINVDLPIYHGTDEEVLSVGIGHVEGSSLPVGGSSTRSILTGHRGLPTSKLFTRLDELNKGDLFFIKVCNETLAYQINDIQKIEPEEVDLLETVPDKDLVTLVTCTPYGINTHRLIVTGERVPYEEKEKEMIRQSLPSWREMIFMVVPFIFLAYMIYTFIKERRMSDEKKN